MVLRKTAKKFDGINPESVRAYNRSHISKTVGIAVVGVDSEDILENFGIAIKLVLKRSQSAKVIQGKFAGKNVFIIKYKGDIHYVGCNTTV